MVSSPERYGKRSWTVWVSLERGRKATGSLKVTARGDEHREICNPVIV